MNLFNLKYLVISAALFLLCENAISSFAYESVPVENGGEMTGTIRFKGDPPGNQVHKVVHNPEFCGDNVTDETYVVNPENKGLQNVVVSLEGINKGKKHEPATIVLENSKCHFVPHVLAGMVGDSYEIRNADPVLHNTHLRFEGTTILNVAMPPNGRNIKKPLTDPGVINMQCDAHTFMRGAIVVFNNPYFAITDKKGEFKISDIPPGKYKIKIWHEGIPLKEQEVTIASNGKTDFSLELNLK